MPGNPRPLFRRLPPARAQALNRRRPRLVRGRSSNRPRHRVPEWASSQPRLRLLARAQAFNRRPLRLVSGRASRRHRPRHRVAERPSSLRHRRLLLRQRATRRLRRHRGHRGRPIRLPLPQARGRAFPHHHRRPGNGRPSRLLHHRRAQRWGISRRRPPLHRLMARPSGEPRCRR